ncbi:hypothetical protein OCU04_009277 [Sclerotinia nivalis]|uniref:Uncharacterized protein n=1 Tax=Sclerotinia nivalis TaxID=352851 RepID=A0A9X0DFY6_9HELO|nr:hypothetical protein OCU04_009277 [Sclerotinia nivalis]
MPLDICSLFGDDEGREIAFDEPIGRYISCNEPLDTPYAIRNESKRIENRTIRAICNHVTSYQYITSWLNRETSYEEPLRCLHYMYDSCSMNVCPQRIQHLAMYIFGMPGSSSNLISRFLLYFCL